LSSKLNISKGTLQRWKILKNIPLNYEFELLKLDNQEIDYKNTDLKKDQIFRISKFLEFYIFIFSKFLYFQSFYIFKVSEFQILIDF
jgi:hypothetical protein